MSRNEKRLETAKVLGPRTSYLPVPARIDEEYAKTLDVIEVKKVEGNNEFSDNYKSTIEEVFHAIETERHR